MSAKHAHIPSKPSLVNPLKLLGRTKEPAQKQQQQQQPPPPQQQPAQTTKATSSPPPPSKPSESEAPAQQYYVKVEYSNIKRPDYFSDREKRGLPTAFSDRIRPGVLLVGTGKALQESFENIEPSVAQSTDGERIWNLELQQLEAKIEAAFQPRFNDGAVSSVYNSPKYDSGRMNMDADLGDACLRMMERYDVTYGSITNIDEWILSAESLQSLNAIDDQGADSESGLVSHAFCLVYKLFLIGVGRKTLATLLSYPNRYVRAVALIYVRYTMDPITMVKKAHLCFKDVNGKGVCITGKEAMRVAHFAEKLVLSPPDSGFLEAFFPPWSDVEMYHVNNLINEHKKDWGELLPLELQEPTSFLVTAEEAREHREVLKHQNCLRTLLPGFDSAETLIIQSTLTKEQQQEYLDRQARLAAEEEERRREMLPMEIDTVEMDSAFIPKVPVRRTTSHKKKDQRERKKRRLADGAEDKGAAKRKKKLKDLKAKEGGKEKKEEPATLNKAYLDF